MKSFIVSSSLVIMLAIGVMKVSESSYKSRKLMSQIQSVKSLYDDMRLEWSQLVLEESTLTDESIIYQVAEKNLGMSLPTAQKVVFKTSY